MAHFAARRTDGKKLPLLVLLAAANAHAQPAITVNPASLTFYATAGQAAPAAIPVSVSSPAAGSAYTASSNQPWLTPMPMSNATGGASTVLLSASAASLVAGVYTGTVRYTAPNFFAAATTVTFIVTTPSGTLQAAAGSPFPVGAAPRSLAVGDFNGDGNLDIVTANSGDNTVTVLLGNGSGGFTAAAGSPFPVGTNPASVAVADFNGDGKPDIVTANMGTGDVTVLLGDGSGGFTAALGSPFTVGLFPQSVAVGDFNGDGTPDIVTANSGDNTVTVLLGNGLGGFVEAGGGPFAAGATPVSVAAGDFNGDGRPDIAMADIGGDAVMVLLGSRAATSSVLSTTAGSALLTLVVTGGFGTPAGTAAFLDGGISIGAATQAPGPFLFAATGLAAGIHVLTGAYAGDSATASSTSNAVLLSVMPASQTITFGPLSNKVYGAAPLALSATASSGLAVVFTSTAPLVCTVAGTFASLVSGGACTIQADQPGDAGYAAAPSVSRQFTVTPVAQTILFGALASQVFGTAPFALSATASSGLEVGFTSTTLPVCTVAGGTVTLLIPGTCTIQASQPGNSSYSAALSVSQKFTVTPAGQTIVFAALPDQNFGTAPFALTATASSGLAVGFKSTTAAVCTVSGVMATLGSVGVCTIQASQAGNNSFAAAAPVMQSFNVNPESQTITFGALSNQTFGTPSIQVSATASSNLAVSFASFTSSVCTVAVATVNLVSVGGCTIGASQAGNSSYAPANLVVQSFTVAQGSQTITFGALSNKVYGTAPFTIAATTSSGLAVTFASNSSVCAVSGATVTLVIGGTCTIQATQPGNANYTAAVAVPQSFTVTPASQTIAFGALANQAFGAGPLALDASASSGLVVSYASTTESVCTASGLTLTLTGAGTCTIEATQPGNSNYAAAPSVSQHFTVTPASQTITFDALQNQALGTGLLTLIATASSGLAVTFKSTTLPVCTVSGANAMLLIRGTCTIQATQPGNPDYAAAAPVARTFTVAVGSLTIGSVLNAGSYAAIPIASDGYTVVFGTDFSTTAAQTTSLTLPTALAGATVTVADSNGLTLAAPLFYVSPTQINFLVPEGLAIGGATVTVTNPAGVTVSFATSIAQVSPALFTADASGTGVPAAIALAYASGVAAQSFPVTATPIDLGPPSTSVYLELYGTGIRGRTGLSAVSVTLGGIALQVSYAGAQSTYAGLDQVNVLLDRSLIGGGMLTLQLTVDGVAANPVTVSIQ